MLYLWRSVRKSCVPSANAANFASSKWEVLQDFAVSTDPSATMAQFECKVQHLEVALSFLLSCMDSFFGSAVILVNTFTE